MEIYPSKHCAGTMETARGTLVITLDPIKALQTVNSFAALALCHYFGGAGSHRIMRDSLCQGGDTEGTGRGGPGYQLEDEPLNAGLYEIDSLAMTNAGPNTNGSQFFLICGPDGARLPPHCSLFGKVVNGLDVVETMQAVATDRWTTPKGPLVMNSVALGVAD